MLHKFLGKNSKNQIHRLGLIICCILTACKDNLAPKFNEAAFEQPKQDKIGIEPKKQALQSAWYEKIDITITKDMQPNEIIKHIANKLNLKILFNLKEPKNIIYSAKKKPFIEVLADLCEICEWKLLIKDHNAKITDDSPYMSNYSIPFLIGERKSSYDTSFSGTPAENKQGFNVGSSASVTTSSTLDAFEELKKNIEMMAAGQENEEAIKFAIHKQGGVLTVIAKQKYHRMIAKYINTLSQRLRNQVLIEARIYEIELLDKFSTGIDWARMMGFLLAKDGIPIGVSSLQQGSFGLGIFKDAANKLEEFNGNVLSFLYQFGNVHSVASPRLMIANNNTSVFKAVDNKVFFKLKQTVISTEDNKKANINQISSEINTIPIGVIVIVQPSVDENGKITIALKPSITEVSEYAEDPGVALMADNKHVKIKSEIPIVKTRELDTIFTTEDDKIVLIGGLQYETKVKTQAGLPLAWLSGQKTSISSKREIVIIIKAKGIIYPANYDELIFLG